MRHYANGPVRAFGANSRGVHYRWVRIRVDVLDHMNVTIYLSCMMLL